MNMKLIPLTLQKKIQEKYKDGINYVSERMISAQVMIEDYNLAIKNIDHINGYFNLFMENAISMYKILMYEHNIKKDKDGDDIKENYNLLKKTYKEYSTKIINTKWLNKLHFRKYKKAINKWLKLTLIMDSIKDLMQYYFEITGNKYTSYNTFEEIYNKLDEAEYLRKSFEHYQQVAEDGSRRLH